MRRNFLGHAAKRLNVGINFLKLVQCNDCIWNGETWAYCTIDSKLCITYNKLPGRRWTETIIQWSKGKRNSIGKVISKRFLILKNEPMLK